MDKTAEETFVEAFQAGAQAMREMLARFVEQGGDPCTATSMRLNWNPAWGDDPGMPTGQYAILEYKGDGLDALYAANVNGRCDAEIAEAMSYMRRPILVFASYADLAEAARVEETN